MGKALFSIAVVCCIIFVSNAQSCPDLYKRYSKDHTFCKGGNPSCSILNKGVSQADIKVILDEHNKYRSRVATGSESTGSLPGAQNMLQMEWDNELQAVAQKHADRCEFKHDCNDCRKVFNFGVGQNLFSRTGGSGTKDWKGAVQGWYDEVQNFTASIIDNFDSSAGRGVIGHFTQVIWATSWKVGCGYSAYKSGSQVKELFTCNYGPGGNMNNGVIYKKGKTCGACPTNSKCGASYKGLCKLNDPNKAPLYEPEFPAGKKLFYCDFTEKNNCPLAPDSDKWRVYNSLSGSFAGIILKGGESSTVSIDYDIKANADTCIAVWYRKGPNVDGEQSGSELIEQIHVKNGGISPINLSSEPNYFMKMKLNLAFGKVEYKLSYKFSVPAGKPAQYFEFSQILVMEGKEC